MSEDSMGKNSNSNAPKKKTNIMYRMPPVKRIRAHQFALTIGFMIVIIVMGYFRSNLGLTENFKWINIFSAILLLYIFFQLTISFSDFVQFVMGAIFIVFIFVDPSPFFLCAGFETFINSFLFLGKWYFTGYLSGWIFAFLYNFFVFIILRYLAKKRNKKNIIFSYYECEVLSIIKSPNQEEEVLEDELKMRKFYDFDLNSPPEKCYTIAFIANPFYLDKDGKPEKDPINGDIKMFMHAVDRGLKSFEDDEVLGAPEIWSRIRVITLYEEYKNQVDAIEENALVGESRYVYQNYYSTSSDEIPNFTRVVTPIDLHIESYLKEHIKQKELLNEIQVVFVLTANNQFDRSSALPGTTISITPEILDKFSEFELNKEIDLPGLAAINILTARQKTYIHEFAHAMTNADEKVIVDEYYDMDYDTNLNTVNRRELPDIYVPKIFDDSTKIIYTSDRDHPSFRENWKSFYPQREAKHIGCIMDRTIGNYQFDKVISGFMYDRLISKVK